MHNFNFIGDTNKLMKGEVFVLVMALTAACLFYGSYYLMFSEEDQRVKVVNQVLSSKGYVKAYDRKQNLYVIDLAVGSSFSDLEKLKGALENVLKSEVAITNNNFRYCVKPVVKQQIPTLVPFKVFDTKREKGLKVAIAMGSNGPIYLDFTQVPHTLVAGATGWGKSIFTKNLILQIISNFPEATLTLFDFKSGIELGDFKNLNQTTTFIIRPDQAEEEIDDIYTEIEDRLAMITATNSRDWMEHNEKSSNKITPKFIIIEEFTILLDQSKKISTTLTKCLAISRISAIFFCFTSQRFSSDIIDSKIKANIDNRVCFHTADAINSKLILDTGGAENLNVVGRCLVSVGGVLTEGQSFYVKESDVKKHTESHIVTPKSTIDGGEVINPKQNKKASNEPVIDNEEVVIWG